MKSIAKSIIVKILAWQVKSLLNKNRVKVVAVVGSIGKTSTKYAIAHTLEGTLKTRWQKGNYNDIVSVPLVFFGQSMPSLFNPFSWLVVFTKNQLQISNYNYDVVVVELGTDGPGQIVHFKDYLKVDIAVVTAVSPEHMQNFSDINAVAEEELSVATFCNKLIVNSDLVGKRFLKDIKKPVVTYGQNTADITLSTNSKLKIKKANKQWISADPVASIMEGYSKTAAAIVAHELQVPDDNIMTSIGVFKPAPGRMQILEGINESIIIDDTYNASPDACIASLHTLYSTENKHKIALLGNMNELGAYSKSEHQRVGKYCDPKQLDLVLTLGTDANKYIAEEATKRGCEVRTFITPYDLGDYLAKNVRKGSIVLAKGSQNKVFMEEALKSILKNKADEIKLVRQGKTWLKKKKDNFKDV